jgi:hypothetical protein
MLRTLLMQECVKEVTEYSTALEKRCTPEQKATFKTNSASVATRCSGYLQGIYTTVLIVGFALMGCVNSTTSKAVNTVAHAFWHKITKPDRPRGFDSGRSLFAKVQNGGAAAFNNRKNSPPHQTWCSYLLLEDARFDPTSPMHTSFDSS